MVPESHEAPLPPRILLDACCVLNLYATGCMAEILRAIPARFGVAAAVAREALWVLRGGEGEDATEREEVVLGPLIAEGLLEVLDLETEEELATFVSFAAVLDDGEAATIALALARGAAAAADDRKALRELQAGAATVEVWTTARLLRAWADGVGAAAPHLAAVLRAVHARARFEPSRHDGLRNWWETQLLAAQSDT